ncbi:MAG: response regulator [Rhodocyclaceae bacterium]|nr:response regulator [Rhodocyclaceae bacterium]
MKSLLNLWPKTLRVQLLLIVMPVISLSIIAAGYFLTLSGRDALMTEKQHHLLGATRLLLNHLRDQGGYAGLMKSAPDATDRNGRIAYMNRRLADYTDSVATSFPGMGVGYYDRELDAILTYGPRKEYGDKVGVAIGPNHPGRRVMEQGVATVESGALVRGPIMNAMTPIVEGGQVVGYIWANELLESIERQVGDMKATVYRFTSAALLFALLVIYFVISRLTRDVNVIKLGLRELEGDLGHAIPSLRGETGEIVDAINALARSLNEAHERERASAAAALQVSEETLRTAIEAVDEAFVMYDQNDTLLFCNEKYREMHKVVADVLQPGKRFEDIARTGAERGMYPDAIGRVDEWLAERTAFHHAGMAVLEQQTGDGRWLRIVDRKTASGLIVGFRIDITDLKNASEAAESASRTKGDFLANMSHEIRTPMNGVIGMTELLLATRLDPEQTEFAETVRNSAQALLGLINDILDFSKIEAGKLDIEIIDFDLRALVSDVGDILALRAAEKEIELTCLVEPEVPSLLRGDPGRVRQILLNLLSNAVKFTSVGEVSLSFRLMEETSSRVRLRVEVKDTGIGIPQDKLGILFSPFTQADSSTTRQFGGTGLGLSITKRLVELMGGEIGVDSEAGQGSCFWMNLPFELQAGPGNLLAPRAVGLAGRRILVVDDNATARRLLEILLRAWECEPLLAPGGAEALALLAAEQAAERKVDAAILDMQMPRMDGEELGQRLKNDPATQQMPLVLLTSVATRGDASRFADMGFAAYLSKPVKEKLLRNCLRTLFGLCSGEEGVPSPKTLITQHSQREADLHARILLVEDNPINQKLAVTLLKKFGHQVDVADNGRQALDALSVHRYDMVFMDCRMPVMDGFEATRAVREGQGVLDARVPIIAMTANAMEGDREEVLNAGMDEYLAKPINPAKLADMVQHWLQRGYERHLPPGAGSPETAQDEPQRSPDLFDPQTILSNLGDDMDIVATVLPELVEGIVAEVGILRAFVKAGDAQGASRSAHTLKGLAGSASCAPLQELALQAENEARRGDLPAAAVQVEEMDALAEGLKSAALGWLTSRG